MPHIRCRFPFSRSLFAVLFVSLILTGCATQQQPAGKPHPAPDVFVDIDAPDETIVDYIPIDDGKPLTREELDAFNSTGELDAGLSVEEKQKVELFFKSYVHNYRGTVERFLIRSEMYMPFVEQVYRERGLPVELANLAFVESGFNPNAVSRAGACGMWQFMPFTGKKYGLSQDRWIDERRDPYKATHAAAEYLTKLRDFFDGDWHLAIAAYNAGEGKIGRALAGTDSKTFFEICDKNGMLDEKARLKEETRQYLPRFLAFVKIMRNLDTLGFRRPDPAKAPKLASIQVPPGVDLRRFAKEINMDWERFKGLNPAYLRSISPPHSKTTARVPEANEKEALAFLGRNDATVYAGWRDYRVKRGDSLGQIAQRTGATTSLLRQANGKTSNSLRIGEYLLVPGSARAARASMAKVAPDRTPVIARAKDGRPLAGHSGTYAISPGDTLYALALKWGTSVDDICLLNDIEPDANLRVGRKLYVPSGKNIAGTLAAAPVERTPEAKAEVSLVASVRGGPGKYVAVQKGDTLFSLARAAGCTVEDICKANGITPKTRLAVGRELYILPGAAKGSPLPGATAVAKAKDQTRNKSGSGARAKTDAKGKVAVIQAGDTLYSLALSHGTSVAAIVKRNRLDPNATLRLGQVIHLP